MVYNQSANLYFQSSKTIDPVIALIQLLRPRATLWRRIEGIGTWGVSFRAHNDLLFCWVASGECCLTRPGLPALTLAIGDFVLVRTTTSFTLASDPKATSDDSETAFATSDTLVIKVGSGDGPPVTLHGGRFLFDTANEDLLTSLLPPLVHVPNSGRSMPRIRTLLEMNASESDAHRPGADFVVERLMELILVELLRTQSLQKEGQMPGMLAGLADPVAAPALRAIHSDIAHHWTVAELARLASVSRSTFATRFRLAVGTGPIEYLLHWRIATARDELRKGNRSISQIAFAVGFQSASAFSTAFSRRVGCAPGSFSTQNKSLEHSG
jgi:AraC-like DNA-binding protein